MRFPFKEKSASLFYLEAISK